MGYEEVDEIDDYDVTYKEGYQKGYAEGLAKATEQFQIGIQGIRDEINLCQININDLKHNIPSPSLKATLDDGITSLELSTRALNVIKNMSIRGPHSFVDGGIKKIRQLIEATTDDLASQRNCGKRTYEEILTQLHKFGYKLADE